MKQPEAVLFDLDGTFADTAQDLAFALNEVLTSQGNERLTFDAIRPYVSKGAPGLIKLGFGLTPDDNHYEVLRQRLLTIYERNICRRTVLFEGIENTISLLESASIPWGIVTNKPEFLTTPLMQQLDMDKRASVVISGDTFEHKKPHPRPLLEACRHISVAPESSWYVGDDKRDIDAAKAANMLSFAALWGYYPSNENPQDWQADHNLTNAHQLFENLKLCLLKQSN